MADISKITLPDNSQYDIKVYTDHIAPMMSKTFTGVIGTAANWTDSTFFYGKILPTSWTDIYRITYKVTAECAGRNDAKSVHICTLSGRANSLISYANWNSIISTGYRPIYMTTIYRAKEAGITNHYGHLLGTRLYYAWNYTTAANSRTIQIDIIRTENCSFEFFDTPVKYSAAPGTGSTNYDNASDMNAADQGLQESGDVNDPNYQNRVYYVYRKPYTVLYRYQILLTKDDKHLLPVNTVNNSFATDKVLTTESFDPFGEIFYYNTTTTVNADSNIGNGVLYRQILADLRYSFNTGTTLVAYKPVYLVASPQSDGSAKLYSDPIAQELPTTEDGLIYIFLGFPYVESSMYRIELAITHPVYQYKHGGIQLYTRDASTVNGHTVNIDVPANAKFTDTTYSDATTSAHGLMTAAMVTKLNGIATGAEVNQNAYSNVTVGSTTISADAKTDTLTLVAGSNVTLTPDATNDKITIAATDTTYESKAAASGGTAVSLVTTGEKYTWNSKTSNTGTVTKVSTGVGLTGGDITTTGTVKAKLKSETASTLASAAMGSTANRQYAVGVDKDGYLSVNVPWAADTDTNVTNTLNNTAKAYLTGTTTATTNTGTQVFDNGVYVTTTAGQLNATTYKVNEKVTLQYDTTAECLNFVFS